MPEYAKNELYARAFKFIKHTAECESSVVDNLFVFAIVDFVNFYIEEEEKESKR